MSLTIFGSDREFQLWKYTVSHKQLLIRSTKSRQCPTRIDVFFKGVVEFHLPTVLKGLFITEASDDEIKRLCDLRETLSFREQVKVFAVRGVDYAGYVAALAVSSHEDEGEYHEPSFYAKNNII